MEENQDSNTQSYDHVTFNEENASTTELEEDNSSQISDQSNSDPLTNEIDNQDLSPTVQFGDSTLIFQQIHEPNMPNTARSRHPIRKPNNSSNPNKSLPQTPRKRYSYKNLNIHSASYRDKTKKMVSAFQSEAQVEHQLELESQTRSFKPPIGTLSTFYRSKVTISPQETLKMQQAVDAYYQKLKDSIPPYSVQANLHELRFNEIPSDLLSPWVQSAPKAPIKIRRAFDKSGVYRSKQQPLSKKEINSDLTVTRLFKQYLYKNHEKIPDILN